MDRMVLRIYEVARREPSPLPGPAEGLVIAPSRVRRVESATLFERGREVVIVHHGQEYRLRITKSDKLILTK
jgi:hemin uptake protein HemP